jgi:hypothetical protein
MTLPTLTWFTLGAILIYLVAQDPKVYTWLVLQSKLLTTEIRRRAYMIRYNPDMPWVRWAVERNANRMAKEMLKEFENR